MQLKNSYPREALKSIFERFKDLLEDESGFLFIYTGKDNKITDVYHNVCSDCVSEITNTALNDAIQNNLLKGGKNNMVKKEKSEIKDIFEGEYFNVWQDGEFYYLSTPFVTLNFSEEDWEAFKKDIQKLSDL